MLGVRGRKFVFSYQRFDGTIVFGMVDTGDGGGGHLDVTRKGVIQAAERQAHDVGIAAANVCDGTKPLVLDVIARGFVERVAAGDVGIALGVGIVAHEDVGMDELGLVRCAVGDGDACVDIVGAVAEGVEHVNRLGGIGGLAENFAIEFDIGVSGDDEGVGMLLVRGLRFAL